MSKIKIIIILSGLIIIAVVSSIYVDNSKKEHPVANKKTKISLQTKKPTQNNSEKSNTSTPTTNVNESNTPQSNIPERTHINDAEIVKKEDLETVKLEKNEEDSVKEYISNYYSSQNYFVQGIKESLDNFIKNDKLLERKKAELNNLVGMEIVSLEVISIDKKGDIFEVTVKSTISELTENSTQEKKYTKLIKIKKFDIPKIIDEIEK